MDSDTPLLWVLRDALDLKGTKFGCGMASAAPAPCMSTAWPSAPASRRYRRVGDSADHHHRRHRRHARIGAARAERLAGARRDRNAATARPGQIMSATALLARNKPRPPTRTSTRAMTGNLCRCATYPRIRAAIKQAAGICRSADSAGRLSCMMPLSRNPSQRPVAPRLPDGERRGRRRPAAELQPARRRCSARRCAACSATLNAYRPDRARRHRHHHGQESRDRAGRQDHAADADRRRTRRRLEPGAHRAGRLSRSRLRTASSPAAAWRRR